MAEIPADRKSEMEDGAAVILELDAALGLIGSGTAALTSQPGRPRNLDTALQQLAPGFERFLKLTFILAGEHLHGARPQAKALRGHGHDLLGLLDALVELVAGAEGYARRLVVVEDLEFMRSEEGVRRLLEVLAYFGAGGRFARTDHLAGVSDRGADAEPSRRWEEIEQELVWARPDVEAIVESRELMEPATFEVVFRLQRLARAIARMWVFGALGEDGGIHVGVLSTYTRLDDTELGYPASL
jgi:hypothetical protein